jgi:hypothetical protein
MFDFGNWGKGNMEIGKYGNMGISTKVNEGISE